MQSSNRPFGHMVDTCKIGALVLGPRMQTPKRRDKDGDESLLPAGCIICVPVLM